MSNVNKENLLSCGWCGKVLSKDMEIEYSDWLTMYFCSPNCATSKYYDCMGSMPLEKHDYSSHKIKLMKDGRLYKRNE